MTATGWVVESPAWLTAVPGATFDAAARVVLRSLPVTAPRSAARVTAVIMLAGVDADLRVAWEWTAWMPQPVPVDSASGGRLPWRTRRRLRRAARLWGCAAWSDLVDATRRNFRSASS